ncbi:hypothetical protein Gohar_002328, partial [Gossypium harknessii]|nr:hypothetical protein [Gossypium harknessii]
MTILSILPTTFLPSRNYIVLRILQTSSTLSMT